MVHACYLGIVSRVRATHKLARRRTSAMSRLFVTVSELRQGG